MEIFVENVFFIILVIIIVSKPVNRGKRNESISPLYEATGITCYVYIYLMFIIVSKPT